MTDFLGNELNVGDSVVALAHKSTSSTLVMGEIEKITDKMVRIKTIGSENDWRFDATMRVYPDKVIKIHHG